MEAEHRHLDVLCEDQRLQGVEEGRNFFDPDLLNACPGEGTVGMQREEVDHSLLVTDVPARTAVRATGDHVQLIAARIDLARGDGERAGNRRGCIRNGKRIGTNGPDTSQVRSVDLGCLLVVAACRDERDRTRDECEQDDE